MIVINNRAARVNQTWRVGLGAMRTRSNCQLGDVEIGCVSNQKIAWNIFNKVPISYFGILLNIFVEFDSYTCGRSRRGGGPVCNTSTTTLAEMTVIDSLECRTEKRTLLNTSKSTSGTQIVGHQCTRDQIGSHEIGWDWLKLD